MTESKKFQRTREDFVCENCGGSVEGSGYTNHCPYCLYSKHVDINPGDRQETCGGLMEPVGVKVKGGEYIIVHRCIRCGFKKRNKVCPQDNMNLVIKLSGRPVDI
ncbi:MAG TPA: RNHCP domain-containing protein [Patescibacteria group bacterium]|nr:RNHCP domain-containing protein [Patescibacteria group bacterium]